LLLGEVLLKERLVRGFTRLEIGRKINKKEQQIAKYEAGEMIPLPVLEAFAEALGSPIQKRIIRRISFARKLELETKQEQHELHGLYRALFDDSDH
ncbi:MAG: helix-turn-helix domain-containing protein, partial [Rickettsiales bacterium]|nr:helix-turn-helix domain-containing protein [Rickettsiales bacterium]